jgi:hypothetical protein
MTLEDFPGSIPIQQRSKPKDTPYHSSMFFKQSNSQLVSLRLTYPMILFSSHLYHAFL